MAVYFLDENDDWFPAAEYAEEDGLLAAGGDLTPKRLLAAYRLGIFPWYQEGGPILWWCPHSRYVIIPSEIHVSASMAKFMRKTALRVSFDEDFAAVIHHCRILREDKEGTWITDAMEEAYRVLHRMGYAHSVEVWEEKELVGGLYGVRLGKSFFGESMFSLRSNASKLALISLARQLESEGAKMIDCQFRTEHLESMGGKYITYEQFIDNIESGMQ